MTGPHGAEPGVCVDVHAHLMPPGLVRDLRAGPAIDGMTLQSEQGRTWVVHRQGFRYPLRPEGHDVEERLRRMDAMGIDVAAVSLAPPLLFYWLPADEAADWARRVNDEIAEFVTAARGRVVGIATLPMQDTGAAVAEAERVAREPRLAGVQVAPMVGESTLDADEHLPVLATLDRLGLPLVLHPYFVGAAHRPGLDRYHMSNLVGHPYQTAVGATRLILSGTLDRLASLRPVLVHGGGYLPYQVGRLDHGHAVRSDARACAQAPSAYLRRFHFDTLTHAPRALDYLVGLVGADRVCFGTDFPADMGSGALAEQAAGLDLSPADLDRIRGGNAAALLGIGEARAAATAAG